MEKNSSVPILFPLEPEKFWQQIRSIIQEEVEKIEFKPHSLPENEPLLTRKEIAHYLKISLVTLHDWKNRRGLPFHRKGGGVRFLKSEVLQWLKEVKSYNGNID